MKTMKQAKAAGQRTVSVVPGSRHGNSLTVLVDDGQTASLYDVSGTDGRYSVQKVDADGLSLGPAYRTTAQSCTCKGHQFGYRCRHAGMIAALSARGAA